MYPLYWVLFEFFYNQSFCLNKQLQYEEKWKNYDSVYLTSMQIISSRLLHLLDCDIIHISAW